MEGNQTITQDAIVVLLVKVSFPDIIAGFVLYIWCWLCARPAERRDVFVVTSVAVWSRGLKAVSQG